MNWQDSLTQAGAVPLADGRLSFGNDTAALAALEQGAALSPLTQLGVIRFSGDDTQAFLQGQLSNDVRLLAGSGWQYSSYSTPKGRMLANMQLVAADGDVLMLLPAALLPAIHKRLGMYVLRSKVRLSDASGDWVSLGLAGPAALDLARAAGAQPPAQDGQLCQDGDGVRLLRLSGQRLHWLLPAGLAAHWWDKLLAAGACPAGSDIWQLAEIRAGIAWVQPATQEAFVPQMANLDLIGAVNFKKGCYPGQEIVARTHYLGKLKRRTLRFAADQAMQAGEAVYSPEMQGQPSGSVALAAPAPGGCWEALVVVQLSSLEHGLHLGGLDGPLLRPLPLPYPLGEDTIATP